MSIIKTATIRAERNYEAIHQLQLYKHPLTSEAIFKTMD